MTLVTDIKAGSTIKLDEKLYRVLEVVRHAGSGQMQGFIEFKLKDLEFRTFEFVSYFGRRLLDESSRRPTGLSTSTSLRLDRVVDRRVVDDSSRFRASKFNPKNSLGNCITFIECSIKRF